MQGLSEFIIDDVRVNVQLLTVTVSLSYDTLMLDGEYDVQGKLVKVIPVSARGPFTVTTNNSKVINARNLRMCLYRITLVKYDIIVVHVQYVIDVQF